MGLLFALRNQAPRSFKGRDAAVLIERYRGQIRFVDMSFIAALIFGVIAYKLNWVASNDWRPLALAFGGGAVVPFLIVHVWLRARDGSSFADFMVALAAHDSCPIWLLRGVLALCVGILAAGIGGYILGKGY